MEDKKNKNPETIVVNIDDNYGDSCIQDSVNSISASKRKPEGFVEIFSVDKDGNKKLVGKSNLVLFCGREWIASRICNLENTDPSVTAMPDEFISWLGLGNGGAPVGDPLNPNTPADDIDNLSIEIPIHVSDNNCADFRGGSYYKHPLDSIEFKQDDLLDDRWLILKVTTTISVDHANGYNLNEAGLFTSNTDDGGHTGPFNIFSIVTFPTIVKDDSRQLVFYWYLYC